MESPRYGPAASLLECRKPPPGKARYAMTHRALRVARRVVERHKPRDRPAVLARIFVPVHARHALLAPLRIAQREIIRAVMSFDQIRVLARVERALRRS